mgnify:CR=1 FL=1
MGAGMMTTTTDMQLVSIDKLIPYANNARTHSPEQVNKLRSSLREFGFINPVIIDRDYNIIAGHGRVLAARGENITEVPCVFVDHLTSAQKKAYVIADNRMAMDAGWDEQLLRVEIEALQGADFDISLTGFDEREIADLFAEEKEAEEDDFNVEEELAKPCFSKTGDIWHLGKHRVICGDSTAQDTYTALVGDSKVNLVCTDPPYMVALNNASGTIANDNLNDKDAYEFLMKAFQRLHEAMAKDASIYVFYATMKARLFYDAYEDARSVQALSGRNRERPSCVPTGNSTWNRSSGAGEKTANISGTVIRNRRQSLNSMVSRILRQTVSAILPASLFR